MEVALALRPRSLEGEGAALDAGETHGSPASLSSSSFGQPNAASLSASDSRPEA